MEIIKLNIIPNGTTPTCHVSQYDNKRVVRIELYEGLTSYTLDPSDEISLAVRKPDNTLVTTSVTNTESNYVDIETTEQMCAVSGFNTCELKIKNGYTVIAMLNFIMQVQPDPTAHGIPSGSALDNLQEQVDDCVEISLQDLYDGTSVMFDSVPNEVHNEPYTVTSAGIKTALDSKADSTDLANYYTKTEINNAFDSLTASDIDYNNLASGLSATNTQQAIDELASQSTDVSYSSNQNTGNKIGDITIDGVTTSLYTGELSTVGDLDDLSDVDTTGKASGDSLRYDGNEWVAKPTTIEMTQAEYNAIVDFTPYANTHIVITDAPNLNATASDIEYSSGVTVKQAIDSKQDSLTVQTITPTRNTTNISTSGYAVSCLKFGRIVVLSVSMTTARALTTDNVILSDLPIPQYDTLRLGLSVIDANNVRVKINASGEMSLHYDDLASGDVIFGEVTYISAS